MPKTTLPGPQRERPRASGVVRTLAAPVAVVTAGWQENENESPPRGLGRKGVNLGIYRRAERVFDEDRELAKAHRDRQLELKRLQRLYRIRLDHAVDAYRELEALTEEADPPTVSDEIEAALETIRQLDQHHLDRVASVQEQFETEWTPTARESVARQRRELAAELEAVESVAVAGGHVAVLLNRLRLFDFAELVSGKNLVAWSAGAMVLAPRIVLFHDSPPWGAGNSEVLDRGLGLFPDVLPFPDCGRRLRIEDPRRVTLLARRFAPLACVGLDERSLLSREGESWAAQGAVQLGVDGSSRRLGGAQPVELSP